MFYDDTIAAIATASLSGGVSILRISGEEAVTAADRILQLKNKTLEECQSHTVHYGFVVDERSQRLDEVIVLLMRAPNSYTREDVVEIQCHGGALICQEILDLILKQGVRIAEPGEFTKRAFLNGRIDLSQAEAVMDLIESKSRYAMESSMSQLKGIVKERIIKLRNQILDDVAFIEAALDDPEHISMEEFEDKFLENLNDCICELKQIKDNYKNGRMIKEGIRTVILGKPNVGKSSLLNALLGEERAIVTEIAGTTRDILEENINLRGISLNVIDTAGIRDTEDLVEKIGVERAKDFVEQADLILYVIDGSIPLDENDQEIFRLIGDKKTIILLNKSDLNMVVTREDVKKLYFASKPSVRGDEETNKFTLPVIYVSTKEKMGVNTLEETLKDLFFEGNLAFNDEIYITNIRHKTALQDTFSSLGRVRDSIESGMPEDFYSIDLLDAYESLGCIIGEKIGEDLVNEIFSKFCMGK